MTMTALLELLLFSALGFSVLYTLAAAIVYAWHRLSDRRIPAARELPPVSILKPLRGLDDQLDLNLRSFFDLDYPEFELIFTIQVENDPAIDVVRRLQVEYPSVPSTLVISEERIGLNPKINNLANGYPNARHPYLLISDSNVRVKPHYLRDMMAHLLMPKVGLVTSTIRGVGAQSLGSILENLHLNSFIAPSVYAIKQIFRVPITIGKSMLIRRETLDRIGGLRALRNHLAEDHLIGQGVKSQGLRIRTSTEPIDNVNQTWTVERFCNRHVRWGKLRRHFNIVHYAGEVLSNPILLALVWLVWDRTAESAQLFAGVVLGKISIDYSVARLTGGDNRIWHFLLIPAKDLLIAGMWLIPLVDTSVTWRGNRFRIGKDTLLRPAIATVSGRVLTLRETLSFSSMRRQTIGRISNLLQLVELSRRLTFYGSRRR